MIRVQFQALSRNILLSRSSPTAMGPPIILFNSKEVASAWIKRPGSEFCHASSFSADVKNEWSCNSNPPYVFMTRVGVALSFTACGVFSRFLKKNPTFF